MNIRNALESDLSSVAAILQEIQEVHVAAEPRLYSPVSLDLAGTVLRTKIVQGADLVVAESGKSLLGYALFEFMTPMNSPLLRERRFCYIHQIGVDVNLRRDGVGTVLLEHVRDVASSADVCDIELDVGLFNKPGYEFFKSAGYVPVRSRMRYTI